MSNSISYSILDLAIVSEGKTIQETLQHSIVKAQLAESLGYTRYWFAEHHNMPSIASSSPAILIGRIAAATEKMKVGSGGVMLPNHSPLIVAEQFGTLGNLFPDRIDLGLGRAPGTDQTTFMAINPNFLQQAHSFPTEIQKIEQYFSKENATSNVRAANAEGVSVPIFVLGSSTDSAHLAAKTGKPYAFASHFATEHLFSAIDIYRSKFQASSSLQKPYFIAGVNVIIADTDEEAQYHATSYLMTIYAMLTKAKQQYLPKATEMTDELRAIQNHPLVQQMIKYSFIGSQATVEKQLKEFIHHTQADELIAVTNIHDYDAQEKSMQYFAAIMKDL